MKKSFSLKTKLFLLSGVLISFSIMIGAINHYNQTKIVKTTSQLVEVNFPSVKTLAQAVSNLRLARIEMLNLALAPVSEKDAEYVKNIQNYWHEFDNSIKDYLEVPFEEGQEAVYKDWMTQVEVIKKGFEDTGVMDEKIPTFDTAKKKHIADIALGPIEKIGPKHREALKALNDFHMISAEVAEGFVKEAEKKGTIWNIVLIATSLIIGLTFTFFLSKNLITTFLSLSHNLDDSSTQVSAASGQIASAAQELSHATTQQAAALQQTSAAIEQMSSMVSKSSENAKSAASISVNSKNNAERGQTVVSEMIHSMSEIDESNKKIMEQINHSNNEITKIVKVIEEIGNKTKVINEIVFQTKLLSFNASVEAARAGEHGKGFAVVAEEVGNLAQMSGNAAKEITALLDGSIQKVENIVNETKTQVEKLIEQGKSKVETGTNVANQCASVLAEIVKNVHAVAQMAEEISAASNEQAQGVNEITKAMQQLDQMTQQNAATSEQSANAAEELSAQAQTMKNVVLILVENVEGTQKAHSKHTDDTAQLKQTHEGFEKTKKQSETKSNVLAFKNKKTNKTLSAQSKQIEPAAHEADNTLSTKSESMISDGSTPSHNSPGFKDV